MARQTVAAGAQPGSTGAAGPAGAGAGRDEYLVDAAVSAGANSVVIDRAPEGWIARQGYIAVGVGTSKCELSGVSTVASDTLTVTNRFHFPHDPGERVVFFGGMRVPMAWWAVPTGLSTTDGLAQFQAAMNAVRNGYSSPAFPLILDCQNKALYVSGPHYIPQNIGIENLRLYAMTGGLYTGPLDGPDNPALTTNAMSVLCQSLDRYTYTQSTNLFQIVDAQGNAVADNNVSVNSPMIFGGSANGLTIPSNLVAGRMYIITEKPSSSTFRLGLLAGGSTVSFGADGAGFLGGQAGNDNCKLYARNVHIDGGSVGEIAITANAGTDVITAASAHGLAVDDVVRFNNPSSGALPAGIEEGCNTYYVQSVPSGTTFTVATTASAGSPLDLTDAGNGGFVVNARKCLNGAMWAMQQNSYTEHIRIDDCKGFGVRIRSQQSHWKNSEFINNGTAIEIGDDKAASGANFVYFSTINSELSDCRIMLVRAICPDIHIRDGHIEEGECRNKIMFDIRGPIENFVFDKTWITAGSSVQSGRKIFRFKTGLMAKSDYHIMGLRGTFPTTTGLKAIEDLDNGISLDMADDFGREGIADFRYFSTIGSTSVNDPRPYTIAGLHGQVEYWGAENATLPYRVVRPGAIKTADTTQYDAWKQLSGGASVVLATGVLTAVAHGLVEGQRVHLATGTATTTNTGDTWQSGGTVCFVRNPTADTFQVSRVPDSNIVTFSAGPATFTVRYVVSRQLAVTATGALAMLEQTDPAAPAANTGLLYVKDNGSGKTQLVWRPPTGTVKVIATED